MSEKAPREVTLEEVGDAEDGLREWDKDLRIKELEEQNGVQDLENGLLEEHIRYLEDDHLTGLKSRKVFDENLEQSLKAIRGGIEHEKRKDPLTEVSLVYIDLDHFKQVNDTLGHPAGDEVLRKVAAILKESTRETDTAARIGGEEMAIIMPGASTEVAARHAEELRKHIEELTFDAYPDLKVTASFGVVSSEATTDMAELRKCADDALYAAKEAGRNRVEHYTGK